MTCTEFLDRVRNVASTAHVPCLCGENCGRYWQLQVRTWWSRLAWWRVTVPCKGDWALVWVRLSRKHSEQIRLAEERG